jgi:nitroreductase
VDDLQHALGGDLRPVLELASRAPSVHNTQPWRFTWDGTALHVLEDTSRSLPVLDPEGRERLISCGAAVLHARLGLAERGHAFTTALLPDPSRPELLATLTVQGRREPDEHERVLAGAAVRRATDRDPFDERPVPDDLREVLRGVAEQEGAWLRFVGSDGSDDAVELQVLLSQADDSQRSDPAYLDELAAWRRERGAEGVPSGALPSVPPELRGSTWVVRDFDAAATPSRAAGPGPSDPPPAEHPAVLVLGTEADDRRDWLVAGQALARVLLEATVAGVAAQPLTQVMEVPVLRGRLRHALGVVGHPQMLLRVGYGVPDGRTSRRPLEEVVDVVE